jgi:hypothetical protein
MSKSPLTRLARWLGLDRNPLRRRSDRMEAAVRLTALLGVIFAVVVGVAMGFRSFHQGVRAEAEQAGTRHLTKAVLVQAAVSPRIAPAGGVVPGHARAQWKAPDGTMRQGNVEAEPTKRTGDVVMVWTDQRGGLTRRPQDRETTLVTSITTGLGIPMGATGVFGLVVITVRMVNQRRARRRWEAEWNAVEPSWRNLT